MEVTIRQSKFLDESVYQLAVNGSRYSEPITFDMLLAEINTLFKERVVELRLQQTSRGQRWYRQIKTSKFRRNT